MKTDALKCAAPKLLLIALMLALPGCFTPSPKTKASGPTWKIEPVMRAGNSPDALRYGESLYRLGRYQDLQARVAVAESYYRKAIAADPLHAEAHDALGVLLARSERLEEALILLDRAVQLAPNKASLRNNLGYAQFLAGQLGPANAQFREALRLEPGNPRAAYNLQLAALPAQPQVASAQPVADLRSAPSLVLNESGPQRIEMRFASQPAAAATPLAEAMVTPAISPISPAPALAMEAFTPVAAPDSTIAANDLADWRLALSPMLFSVAGVAHAPAYRLEISNAMGMRGAARRVKALLMREGVPVARLNDQRPFTQQQTLVHYARGYQAEAEQLARRIGAETAAGDDLLSKRAVHLRIVLGKDVRPLVASLPEDDQPPQLAAWAPPAQTSSRASSWLALLGL